MYKIGYKFKVKKNGIIGEVTGVSATGIYSVIFSNDNEYLYQADVYEGTIKYNLKTGFYNEVK